MELDAEQQALISTVTAVLEKRSDSAAVRTAIASPAGFDTALWETLVEQIGVAALVIPEEYDGAGATLVEAGLVLEQLGAALTPSPLLASLVAATALVAAPGDQATALLPRIAAGELATLALPPAPRRGPHSAPQGQKVGAERAVLRDGRLTGTLPLVPYGDQATILLVGADRAIGPDTAPYADGGTGDGPGPALCLLDPADVRAEWTPTMDQTARLATLVIDGTATVIAEDATAALAVARAAELAGIAALATGTAQHALDLTVAYSKERVQFGRPIGSFQALKHRMADLLVLIEMSRSASWAAARGLIDPADAAGYATEALQQVAAETVQLHGGIAITWEHDAHLIFKRAHALAQLARAAGG